MIEKQPDYDPETHEYIFYPEFQYKSLMGRTMDHVIGALGDYADDFDQEAIYDDIIDVWEKIFERHGLYLVSPYMQVKGNVPLRLSDDDLVRIAEECEDDALWNPILEKHDLTATKI